MRRKIPNPLPHPQHLRLSPLFGSADLAGPRRTNLPAGMMRSQKIGLNRAPPPRGDGAGAGLDVEVVAGRAEEGPLTSRSNPSTRRET